MYRTYVRVQRHVYVQHYRTSSARNTLQLLRISNKNVSFVSAVTVTLITNRYHRLERKMWHTKSKGTFYMQIRMRSVTTDNILMRCGVVSNIGNDNRWFTSAVTYLNHAMGLFMITKIRVVYLVGFLVC